MKVVILGVAALLFCFSAGPDRVDAQQRRMRTVTGTVTDLRGNPLPGASVRIENERSLAIASYITRNDGKYAFHELNPDMDFTLRAKYKRWWSKEKMLSRFNEKAVATVDLTIPVE